MDFAERERLMRYYEQKFTKELDETCPRVNFVTSDLFKSAWNMGPPHPAEHLSQGAQQLMSHLGPFEPLTAEGLGKMRRKIRLFTHPDKKRPESCFYDEFSSYFDALDAYHEQHPQQKQVPRSPPPVFVPVDVQPLSAHSPPLSPVVVPVNVQLLSAHSPPLSPVSSQRTESVVMNDVGDLGDLALSPPPLEDSTSSDNDMHVPSPQPLSPQPLSPQRKTKRKSSGGAISSRHRRRKNKRKSNDDISFHPQHYPLQTSRYEFYIHQLLSKDPKKENSPTRTAIIAAIAWMKKGNNETISIADIRNTMSEYPNILILTDRSNVSDEWAKTTQEFHDLRNRNQALKTNMKKNNNKMQLTDDITLMLILSPTSRTTTDGESYNSIFYSVEIKNS